MGSIVLKSLSILLGVFFIFVGITKLTPFISKELHKDLVSGHYLVRLSMLYLRMRTKRSLAALRFLLWSDVDCYFGIWPAA